MRHFPVLFLMALCATGCGTGVNTSSSGTGEGSTEHGSQLTDSSSSTSTGSGGTGSSKSSKDPLVRENKHLNEWLKDAESKDPTGTVPRAAAKNLGEIAAAAPAEAPRIVPVLVTLLQDKNPKVRISAAEALSRVGPNIKDAVPALGTSLHEKDPPEMRDYALLALKNAGADAAPALDDLKTMLGERDLKARYKTATLAVLGQLKVEPGKLLHVLKIAMADPDSTVGDEAVRQTVKLGDPALDALQIWLRDANETVNRRAAEALAKFGEKAKPAMAWLIKDLNDADAKYRIRVAMALGAIGDPAAIKPLMDKLEDEDLGSKAADALILVLEKNGKKAENIEPLIKIVKDGTSHAKVQATHVLVKFGKPAVAPLLGLFIANDTDTLEIIAKALGDIGPDASDAKDKLIELLPVKDTKTEGLRALTKIFKDDLAQTLVARLGAANKDPISNEEIEAVLKVLVIDVKLAKGTKLDVTPIVKLLKHEDEDIQTAAAAALKKLDPDTAKKNGIE